MTTVQRVLPVRRAGVAIVVIVLLAGLSSRVASASAADVSWSVQGASTPSSFSENDSIPCEREGKCDQYQLLVLNSGDAKAPPPLALTDRLPAGIHSTGWHSEAGVEERRWSCHENPERSVVQCTLNETIEEGTYAPALTITVTPPVGLGTAALVDSVTVAGGGATREGEARITTPVTAAVPLFEATDFGFDPRNVDGDAASQAGGHPWQLTAHFGVPATANPAPRGTYNEQLFSPAALVKSVSVELPEGFIGDPLVAEHCTQTELVHIPTLCPPGSKVGVFAVIGGLFETPAFTFTGDASESSGECCSAIYNMVPQGGYPAEFAFTYAHSYPIEMFANLVHTPAGYRVRIDVPGLPPEVGLEDASVTFFGEPGAFNGTSSPEGREAAFLSNPGACTGNALSASLGLTRWGTPTEPPPPREAVAYEDISNCAAVPFKPGFSFTPSSSGEGGSEAADEPSAFTADLAIPQSTKFSELSSGEVRTASVQLPAGVSLDPSAGAGLVGCAATGPNGVNIGSDEVGPEGRDIGDPEATELGAGYPGGDGSSYTDGVYHEARGHCPAGSTVGTVEVTTPLLEKPLTGHLYVAQPKCGGAGQPECTEASATNGELFGAYIEVAGSGVIVKLPGRLSANPATGQLTASFTESPQLPFSDLKVRVDGGPRAPLANPQSCGEATTSTLLEPWSAPQAPDVTSNSSYAVTGCAASMGFAPSFTAGTVTPAAGAYSPFVLSFGRGDREQDLSGLSVTLPSGLLARIAGVAQCGEVQANAGTCPAESLIGTTSATAGAGADPLYVGGGRVYLTTGYKGQPFGLSVVVPAVAGPFNLGSVVVRAAIHVNPSTAQVTVVSDPLPQLKDGVPLRLRSVNVEVDRSGFTFNPTNCAQQSVTGTVAAAQGATAAVSSPFAATGCNTLPFKPVFTAATAGRASKAGGASLDVRVGYPAGSYANIAKVRVDLPRQLPSRLSTLQKACTAAQFAANPAGCPQESDVGTATAVTPILANALSGPAYLVSHGNEAFPDLEIVLQGEGVLLILDGNTDIKAGITSSTFNSVPDAPISSFELKLPTGKFSVLGTDLSASAHYSLCGQKLVMPTTLTGQNGALVTQSTQVGVTGCPKVKIAVALTRAQKLARALKACHKDRLKVRRGRCEVQAERRYGVLRKGVERR